MDNSIAIYIISLLLSLAVMYYIIRGAVIDGTAGMRKQFELQNWLKVDEMRKAGFDDAILKEHITKAEKKN